MKVIDSSNIAFIQAVNQDDLAKVLIDVRSRCTGVDKLIVIKRVDPTELKTKLYTFCFKGHNG